MNLCLSYSPDDRPKEEHVIDVSRCHYRIRRLDWCGGRESICSNGNEIVGIDNDMRAYFLEKAPRPSGRWNGSCQSYPHIAIIQLTSAKALRSTASSVNTAAA